MFCAICLDDVLNFYLEVVNGYQPFEFILQFSLFVPMVFPTSLDHITKDTLYLVGTLCMHTMLQNFLLGRMYK